MRLEPRSPERCAAEEMTLGLEDIVNSCVGGEEALCDLR